MNEVIEKEMALENEETILENQENNDSQTEVSEQASNFEPMQIGEPDYAAILETENHYEAICNVLNDLFSATKEIVLKSKELSADDFFSFIESRDPERWCYRKYITAAELSFQNMDHERVIDLKLFQIENLNRVLQLYQKFKALKGKQVKFDYPIRKLFVTESNKFSIDNSEDAIDSFYVAVEKRFSFYTETPDQNMVLEILNGIAENFNKLAFLGILRGKNGITELDVIESFFNLNKLDRENSPFKVNSYIFKGHNRLSPYRVKKEIIG